jgi:hypothetical protein
MKTTVELPDKLLFDAKQYASSRGKSLKDVLIEALDLLMYQGQKTIVKPGWESLFGAFADDPELAVVRDIIDVEFSKVDPEDWR